MTNTNLPWTVLLIGGASGCGKTSVSYDVARHFGVAITEVDDFQVILKKRPHQSNSPPSIFGIPTRIGTRSPQRKFTSRVLKSARS